MANHVKRHMGRIDYAYNIGTTETRPDAAGVCHDISGHRDTVTPNVIDAIESMLCRRISPEDIASELGCSPYIIVVVAWRLAFPAKTLKDWTPAENETARRLHGDGVSSIEIAKTIGRTYGAVTGWLTRERRRTETPAPRHRQWTKSDCSTARRMLKAGESYVAVSDAMGRTPAAISGWRDRQLKKGDAL